jgi:drug/metabolite transporter (DMT)-like permease
MFSWFMLPGILLAIGVSGLVWWSLKEFTRLEASKADGLAVVSGLAMAFILSLAYRGLLKEPIQVGVTIIVLILSYLLVQFEKKRHTRSSQKKHEYTPKM